MNLSSSTNCDFVPSRLPERPSAPEIRHGIARTVGAWGFGAVYFNLIAGAIWVSFARHIGANDQLMGLMSAAMPVTGLFQLFAARAINRSGRPKSQMIWSGIVGRLLWLLIALLPLLSQAMPHLLPRGVVLPLVLCGVLLSGVAQAFNTPAFFAWMGGLVPDRLQPGFYARRTQLGTCAGLLAILVSGWIADASPHLATYSTILAVAAICGILDVSLFYNVREVVRPTAVTVAPMRPMEAGQRMPLRPATFVARLTSSSLLQPLRDVRVRTFLWFVTLMSVSLGLTGTFTWLQAMERLGWSKTLAGLLLSVAPLSAVALFSRFWGDIIKQHGTRPVNRFVSAALVLMPLVWFVEGPCAPWVIGAFVFLSGALFAGYDQCNQNAITGMTERVSPATMTALFSLASGGGFALASCGGGALAQHLHGLSYESGGVTLNAYHVLFGLSFLLRFYTAVYVAPRLVEPEATPTRAAVRDVLNRRFARA